MAKKVRNTLPVSMADIEKMYGPEAQAAAAAAPVPDGPPRISTKDQQFVVGEVLLQDPLQAIVVAEGHLNVWYDTEYDPEDPQPPACFAVARVLETGADGRPVDGTGEASMKAHATSPKIQGGANGHDCATCEKNRFGSADKGSGKACANTRQLAIVMADDPALAGGDGAEPRIFILGISATALRPWGKWVKNLAEIVKRPPHGVVTQFSFNKKDPNERARKAVIAIGYKKIDDVGVATKVNALRKKVLADEVLQRPLPVEARSAPPAREAKRGGPKRKAKPAQREAPQQRQARF